MPTGASRFIETLRELGISDVFTLVGDHLNEALAEAARQGLRVLDFRHESGAVHAADTYARVTRRPAVTMVTGGPGHTNSLTGIATANLACSPLIAVSGSRPAAVSGRGGFQDIDQVGMARPVVKWAAEVGSARDIPAALHRAFGEATNGRMGVAHLSIPVDVFAAEAGGPSVAEPARYESSSNGGDYGRAIELLRAAKRPIVLAGSGIWWADAGRELRAFVERTSLPAYTITMARGVLPDSHPLCFGYGDPSLNRAAQHAFREADVVLLLGKRMDYRLAFGKLFSPEANFIQVDIHAPELGLNRAPEVPIRADARAALAALLEAAGREPWAPLPWLDRLRELRAEWESALQRACDPGSGIHPAALYQQLKTILPADTLISWDGGDFVHWGRCILPALQPGGWMRLGPLATIGSALPNAMAMQWANPDRPVCLITGDGSFGFYIAELDTAVRFRLPVVMILGNDAAWGLERELQSAVSGLNGTVACELRRTRYDLVMQGFGGLGETVDSLDQFAPAVERAFSRAAAERLPYLLNVNIRGVRSPFAEWQLMGKKK